MKATTFEFVRADYAPQNSDITFLYRMHFADADPLEFEEKITLSDPLWAETLPSAFVSGIIDDLHLLLGISYYKTFCPPAFKYSQQLSEKQVYFWNTLYTKGLSEFLYRNNIAPDSLARFSETAGAQRKVSSIETQEDALLVGIGGGKDSIVALELLQDFDVTGFIKSEKKGDYLAHEIAQLAGIPLCVVSRELDNKLFESIAGAYQGHVPVSAIYAFLGVLQAASTKQRYFVVANEHSSNFGNFIEEGNEVNHKWSGSAEFEMLFQDYVRRFLTPDIGYFSVTRPFYELRVVQQFVALGEKYFETFSSCNRNFSHTHTLEEKRWCGQCPKCAFTYLLLSAFVDEATLLRIFKKNLFEDSQLLPLYKDLLGLGTMKPFDCVGTFDESKVALTMASERFADTLVVKELLLQVGDTTKLATEVFRTQKALTVPSQFRFLGMTSALILGYGKEGHATENYLKAVYPELRVGIADQNDGSTYLEAQNDFDIVLKTPVIPGEKVERQYTTATNIFFNEVSKDQIIGITGSKGKSTTATLLYQMLLQAGKNVRLVGNIGVPALESLLEKAPEQEELFVFELSSYQLADLDISPHISVVTSLFPEHLDHHGSLEAYYEAKRNITRFQTKDDLFIYQPAFSELEDWALHTQAQTVTPEHLPFRIDNPALPGQHNVANAELAYTVAKIHGVTDDTAQQVLGIYEGLPHRLQNIGTYKGITFYNDSISTTPESAIAALQAIEHVETIILGGVDRGYTFNLLEEQLHESGVKNIVLFPESGEHMVQSEEGFNVLHTDSMEEAVQFAFKHTQENGVCLLSPAAPSYNLFANFQERGDLFTSVVEQYGYGEN